MLRFTHLPWIVSASILLPVLVGAQPASRYVPDQLIVKFKPTAQAAKRTSFLDQIHATTLHELSLIGAQVVKLDGTSVEDALALARQDASLVYAEPDWILTVDRTPNDPRFPELYAMRNVGQTGGTSGADIRATEAWDVFTGSYSAMVGVIDTGIDYTHPDLADNIWTNGPEASGLPGIDDDNNGYVDDIHGYDFVNNDGDPMDDHFHGTHCAGTIGAVGDNGVGVAGVNWRCTLVGIKFLNAAGSGTTSGAIRGVEYAVAVGVHVTSNSYGGGGFSQAFLDAITIAGEANQLFVCAAGNAATNIDADGSAFYPAQFDSPYVITVAATDASDQLAFFSNYGLANVDLGAPGVAVLSTVLQGQYASYSGTSMATPHVAGVCGLIVGNQPGISNTYVRSLVLNYATPIPALAGKCVTGARLNAMTALTLPLDMTNPAPIVDLTVTDIGSTTLEIGWTETGDDGAVGNASRLEVRYSTTPLDAENFASAHRVSPPRPAPPGTQERVEIVGLSYDTTYFVAVRVLDEFGNAALSNVASATTRGAPTLAMSALGAETLLSGARVQRTVRIENVGAGRLDFTVPTPEHLFVPAVLGTQKSEPAPPIVDGWGGPDAFGYRWSDSDQPGGPTFSWIDILQTGTRVDFLTDYNQGNFPIGFEFPFYGKKKTTFRICSAGWMALASDDFELFENIPLPSLGQSAKNMIAPYWEDMLPHHRPAGGEWVSRWALYQTVMTADGNCLVVTWHESFPWGYNGGPYTFQALLFESGEIRFQYLVMTPLLASPTIGIQNETRTIGTTVAFSNSPVHNGMAIRLFPQRPWLSASPSSGHLEAGQGMDLVVTYDALGHPAGQFEALVHVYSNEPRPDVTTPTSLQVIGAPHLVASQPQVDFGFVYSGHPETMNVFLTNMGTSDLSVASVTSGDPALVVTPGGFVLAPGEERGLDLTWNPGVVGSFSTNVTIQSNDPDEPETSLAVAATVADAPAVNPTPAALVARLLPNSVETRTLRLTNATSAVGGPLDFTVFPTVFEPGVTPKPGAIASQGGPDTFGYTWIDSREPNGPAFEWIDITAIGTRHPELLGDERMSVPIPLGFDMPFYGTEYSTAYAGSNGYLSLVPAISYANNPALPSNALNVPRAVIAPFWDDLNCAENYNPYPSPPQVYSHTDGNRCVISFVNLHGKNEYYAREPQYTFQVILYPGGKIVLQYLEMRYPLNTATIGMQNEARTIGLQIAHNESFVQSGLAIEIRRTPEWLAVTPTVGSLGPGQFVDLDVTFDSAGLAPGEYLGRVRIDSNDPNVARLDVPVTLQVVTDPTDVAADRPAQFALALANGNPVRGEVQFRLAVPQREMLDVRVFDVRGALVRSVLHRPQDPGTHAVTWDGRDERGTRVAGGIYFVRLRAGAVDRAVRVVLVR